MLGGLRLTRKMVALAGGLVVGATGIAGAAHVLWPWPDLHVASSAQECVNAPDHLATLFSDDQSTSIRLSNLDYSDLHVLRVEPAATLPGMFTSLLALSSDSRRLAYVTANDELMDGARIQYIEVASPDTVHPLVQLTGGLAPVRPAWSASGDQLAYVIGRPASASRPAGFEVWSVRSDGTTPQRVSDLPLDVFARGHAASLCFTPGGQIGLLEGVESAQGPPSRLPPGPPSLLPGPASAARAATPSPASSTRAGSPCGVPVFSQNDPTWQSTIMQLGGDPIGGFGCALTSTTMLLNYYGAIMSPPELNACLGSAADPIHWSEAPGCTNGRVRGGVRVDFSWDRLDGYLKQGRPAIVGMVRGQTGTHFVVVTRGGGGEADSYSITDPWDGSTTKTLGSYTNAGYNPLWIVTYDGAGRNCGRLVPSAETAPRGVEDGGVYQGAVTVAVPAGSSGSTTVQPAGDTTSRGTTPVRIRPGAKHSVTDEGTYLLISCTGTPPQCRIVKFTIDHTPPVLSLHPLNPRPTTDSRVVLDRPGRLRLDAVDTLSGVRSVEYRLDGAPWMPYSDDVSFGRAIALPTVGAHTISIRATDLAGNVAEIDDQAFEVVDATPSASPGATPAATPTPAPRSTPPAASTPMPTPTPPLLTVSVSPGAVERSTANCPAQAYFTHTATISYTGSASATFNYVWVRSDGRPQGTGTLSFTGPGTQQLQTMDAFWEVLAPGTLTGWIEFELLTSPPVFSNRAGITVICAP